MVLVVNDSALGDLRELSDFELDLAFGIDENAFSLECDAAYAPAEGQFVFIDGCEYGGVVDKTTYKAGRESSGPVTCKGRTWHGILAGKRLLPDSGSGYLSVSGRLARCSRRSSNAWGSLGFSPPLPTIRRCVTPSTDSRTATAA